MVLSTLKGLGFTPTFGIVDKFKKAQIQGEFFLRDAPMRSQPGT
jgi:hypothetical protein